MSEMNQQRYWIFKRRKTYYLQDSQTGKQTSLRTRNRKEAEQIRTAKNQAASQPFLNLALASTYLSAHDPEIPKRTWKDILDNLVYDGQPSTIERYRRAMACKFLDPIRDKKLIQTTCRS